MQSTRSFVRSYFKKLPAGIMLLLVLLIAAIGLFTYFVHEVIWDREEAVDNDILHYIGQHMVSGSLTGFMKAVTYFASAPFLQIAYGVIFLVFLWRKDIKRGIEIAVIGLGGFLINYFMKLFFHRLRPTDPLMDPLLNFSFPSGHATSGFIFYGTLAYLVWKSDVSKGLKIVAAVLLILFSLLIGFSRLYLRMHYPSDVGAGFAVGFAWLILCIYIFERLKKKTDREGHDYVKVSAHSK